ncbi:uncharacterized protein [Rutidosis leptorrhynchoides]|uniref:uncharacterized protein n=1 Tax=Rutidosis leptorrhynchoides TaxID=125765 RepID=UPI003A9A3EEE
MEPKEESSSSSCGRPVSDTCPICLSPFLQQSESYLDQCFHKFCYTCILHWTKVSNHFTRQQSVVKCPLCKRKSSSIIHGYDGISFQKHLINLNTDDSAFFTNAHKYRLQCYYINPGDAIGNIKVSRYWKSYKYRQPNQWLYSWVTREIQALIQEKDVDIIVHHIIGVIDSWRRNESKESKILPEMKQEVFKSLVADAAKPFLTGRTDRFVNELEMFVASGLNIEAYDKVYVSHLGWKIAEIATEEDDEEPVEREPVIPLLSFYEEDLDETT